MLYSIYHRRVSYEEIRVRESETMKKAKANNASKLNVHYSIVMKAMKCDKETVHKLAVLEKQLMLCKANKEANKCKVKRQSMRNLKFYRHEHTAETIASLQAIANAI